MGTTDDTRTPRHVLSCSFFSWYAMATAQQLPLAFRALGQATRREPRMRSTARQRVYLVGMKKWL